jgi:hypothetical protein
MKLKKILYHDLNSRQKETYNFQKISSILADYGFATIKLNDDWQSADFIAQHIDGETFLKIQLKGRLTFSKKYFGKKIYICFPYLGHWYLFNHDDLLILFLEKFKNNFAKSQSWLNEGGYSWGVLSKEILEILSDFEL